MKLRLAIMEMRMVIRAIVAMMITYICVRLGDLSEDGNGRNVDAAQTRFGEMWA